VQANIDGMGATESPLAIDIVGNYLVVIGSAAYYYAEINKKTGVPGAFTKVTTGFVAAKNPYDLYVASSSEIWFVGDGGYIYKSVDITAGVTVANGGSATTANLRRIRGREGIIVATGASGAVVKTTNRGVTWSTTTASPENSTIQAVEVMDDARIWVGCSTGRVYFTGNGGETWTPDTHFSGGSVQDIVFATQEVGYVSASVSGTCRIYATWNGGANWTRNQPRILNLPVFTRGNRLAIPSTDDAGWASNTLAIAGLAGDGTDGIVVLGVAGSN
jgi:photosystem II stability/assembly factor-like uncharacterized protein